MVQILETIESRFLWFSERPLLSIVILWSLTVVMYGLTKYHPMHYYIMTIDLGGTHTSLPYKQDSILLPILGHYLGLISDESQVHWQEHNFFLFLTFCYAAIVAGFAYTAAHLRSRFGREPALLALVILVLHPVILVLVNRIGVPDAFTFLFTALVLFQRSIVVLFVVALLGMMNHPLFLFIAPPLVLLRICATSDSLSIRWTPSVGQNWGIIK